MTIWQGNLLLALDLVSLELGESCIMPVALTSVVFGAHRVIFVPGSVLTDFSEPEEEANSSTFHMFYFLPVVDNTVAEVLLVLLALDTQWTVEIGFAMQK